jgi:hypothetical protein
MHSIRLSPRRLVLLTAKERKLLCPPEVPFCTGPLHKFAGSTQVCACLSSALGHCFLNSRGPFPAHGLLPANFFSGTGGMAQRLRSLLWRWVLGCWMQLGARSGDNVEACKITHRRHSCEGRNPNADHDNLVTGIAHYDCRSGRRDKSLTLPSPKERVQLPATQSFSA